MIIKQKIGTPVNFRKAKFPLNKKIIGKYSYLESIKNNKHAKDLFNNFSLDKTNTLWTYMPYGPFKNLPSFKSYLRIKPEIGTIEVGWITYAPILQRTAEATEAMYLMMSNAFDNLGYRRYEWKCDILNLKSRKAALRLGFKYEGVFRQATIYKKRNRDTAWFSIVDKEWKKHKKKYLSFLKQSNFDNKLNQKKKLKI